MVEWIKIHDADLELACKEWEADLVAEPDITQIEFDTRYGLDLGLRTRTFKLKEVYFDNKADAEDCIKNLSDWNVIGAYTFQVQVSSAPAYFKLDGNNTTVKVLYNGYKGLSKASNGDQQIYIIKLIEFEQAED